MKSGILSLLTREPVAKLFRPFQHGAVTIFMLHRFADSEYGNRGHSIDGGVPDESKRGRFGECRRGRAVPTP